MYRLNEFIWKNCNESASCYDAVRRYLRWLRSALTNRVLTALIALMEPLWTGCLWLFSVVLTFIFLSPLMFHLSDEEKTLYFRSKPHSMLCSVVGFSESSSLDSDFILYITVWTLTSFRQNQQYCDNISFGVVMETHPTTYRDVWSEEASTFAGDHGGFFFFIVFNVVSLHNTYGNRKTLHEGLLWGIISFGNQHCFNLA